MFDDDMDRNNTFFMNEALRCAKKATGWTNPHPMVGAVIVKNGKIIASGYHRRFGADHAEMDALKHAKADVTDATMYVTLEPCHLPYDLHGERMPCTDVIRQAGIRTVHIAMLDSNPEVAGKGREVLEQRGTETTLGMLGGKALQINEAYHHFMTRHRPFIASTFSASLDGKLATHTGDSKWITNERARAYSRGLRAQYQAIVVGIHTVIRDDPHLGARMKGKKDPIRIILDSKLVIPPTSQILRDNRVIIATTHRANKHAAIMLKKRGVTVLEFDSDMIPLDLLIQELTKRKIVSVLVEGGGTVHGSFFDRGLIDKVYAFHSPILIGGRSAVSAIEGDGSPTITKAIHLTDIRRKQIHDSMLTTGYPVAGFSSPAEAFFIS